MTTKEIPASVGAKLLDINRTSIYYKGTPVSEEELSCKEIIDHLHTDNPTWGARQMSAQLKARGYHVGRRKARRYMNEMDIYPIYPKMNLSKRMQQAKVCPYLLRNAVICGRPAAVCCCHCRCGMWEIHSDPPVCNNPFPGRIHFPLPVRFKAYPAVVL